MTNKKKAKAKATPLAFRNLFDLVLSKSKAYIDKAKRPLLEKKSKREFKSMVDTNLGMLIELKEETLELLTDVRDLDVPSIVNNMKDMETIEDNIYRIADVYRLVFSEELELDLDEINLEFDLSEVLGRVQEIEEDDTEEETE